MHVSVPEGLVLSSTTVRLEMVQAVNRRPHTAELQFPPFAFFLPSQNAPISIPYSFIRT
jgi:hypothetical protein